MKARYITIKRKETHPFYRKLTKAISNYINAVSKGLYPSGGISEVKNDRNRFFYK